ncbi:MAG: hypothetical protein PF689_14155 [Deltaproteobacteria bacterium]|jgi:hypothetical protein|nr:hypothetical protein [Deltaproteobacteria bacterium]
MANSPCPFCGLKTKEGGEREHLFSIDGKQPTWLSGDKNGCIFSINKNAKGLEWGIVLDPALKPKPNLQRICKHEKQLAEKQLLNRIIQQPDFLLISHLKPNFWIPLAAWKLKYKTISVELLWSWFKIIISNCASLHELNIYHGNISEESLIINERGEGKINDCQLSQLGFNYSISKNTEENIQWDLTMISNLFLNYLEQLPDNFKNRSFKHLLLEMETGKYNNAKAIANVITPFERLHLYAASQNKTQTKVQSTPWKKYLLYSFPLLFILSLIIANLGSPEKDMSFQQYQPYTQPKIKTKPKPALIIDSYKGVWNSQFPLHRVDKSGDLYIYLNLELVKKYQLENMMQISNFLGYKFKLSCIEKSRECFSIFKYNSKRNLMVLRLLAEKKIVESTRNSANKSLENSKANFWQTTYRRKLKFFRNLETPDFLIGLSGKLLKKVNYNPRNIQNEVALVYWKYQEGNVRRKSIWNYLFGGIHPSNCLVRIYLKNNTPYLGFSGFFPNSANAESVANQLDSLTKSYFGTSLKQSQIENRFLTIKIKISNFKDLL